MSTASTTPENVAAGAARIAYLIAQSLESNGRTVLRAERFTNARASVHTALKALVAVGPAAQIINIDATYSRLGGTLPEGASIVDVNGYPIAAVVHVTSDVPIPEGTENSALNTLPIQQLVNGTGTEPTLLIFIIDAPALLPASLPTSVTPGRVASHARSGLMAEVTALLGKQPDLSDADKAYLRDVIDTSLTHCYERPRQG